MSVSDATGESKPSCDPCVTGFRRDRVACRFKSREQNAAAPNNGLGVASLVVGVIAVAMIPLPFILSSEFGYGFPGLGALLVAICSLGLGIAAYVRVKHGFGSMAVAVGIVLFVLAMLGVF